AHQCLQPLLGAGVAVVVQPVHVQGGGNRLDVVPGYRDLGLIGAAHDLRHHQGGKDAEDDHHHHDLDQREAVLRASLHGIQPTSWLRERIGIRIASTMTSTVAPMNTSMKGSNRPTSTATRAARSLSWVLAVRASIWSSSPERSPLAIMCSII